jgi:hypothetical protein
MKTYKNLPIEKQLLILSLDLDPDPELDKDPRLTKSLDADPDPYIMNADPKHYNLQNKKIPNEVRYNFNK